MEALLRVIVWALLRGRSRMWSPKWDRRRQRASEDTTSCGIHGGSGRIIPSPIRSSDIGAGTLGGRRGCSIPLPSRDVQHPIGWLMTPNCVRSQDRLPAWQAGADPAALRPLGTKPFVCWRLGSSPTPGWRTGAPSVFCQIPAFSVRWMLTACKGKKGGSCDPGWIYVTSCPACELPSGGLISVRSAVQV